MTTCTLEQLPDFLWMPPHHKPGKQRQHSSFNQQMSKEKHTECLLPSQSFLKRWQGFGIRRSTPDVPPHFFKSHRECVCVCSSSTIQSRTEPLELPNLPACCSSGGALWLAGYTRCHIHTHTQGKSALLFSPLSHFLSFRSLSPFLLLYISDSTSVTLSSSLSLYLPLHSQQGEAHMFSVVSSAGSVWFKAIIWLQKET